MTPFERTREQRQAASADLNAFFHDGLPAEDRDLSPRCRAIALGLLDAVREIAEPGSDPRDADTRLLTDRTLRAEYARDQDAFLDGFLTRRLANPTPDVVFLPNSTGEVAAVLSWARESGTPVTLRGAGSTSLAGSVPADAGVVLDLSQLDEIRIDRQTGVVILGAGARFRVIHAALAAEGLALPSYPANLGGTYAGWLATGGIGLNSHARGPAAGAVEWIEVVLPTGEPVRVLRDRTVQVPMEAGRWQSFPLEEAREWFEEMNLPEFSLEDWAGSEGQFGVITRLAVLTGARRAQAGFLLGFARERESQEFLEWLRRWSPGAFPRPSDVRWLSPTHLDHARRARADDDLRAWRRWPGDLATGKGMPWTRLVAPDECGLPHHFRAEPAPDDKGRRSRFAAYVFADFMGMEAGVAFCRALDRAPGSPRVLVEESLRISAGRFRPQASGRFGPGRLAAEILMPAHQVGRFLPEARRRARGAGVELDVEVCHLPEGNTLIVAGYLVDRGSGASRLQGVLAAALSDLALRSYGGRPYVLGRWQALYFQRGRAERAGRQQRMKDALDPAWVVNRGSYFRMELPGAGGRLARFAFRPVVRLLGAAFGSTLMLPFTWMLRALFSLAPGPARGRGRSADRARPEADGTLTPRAAVDRALTCVNCGECNSVCPVFRHSGIRLPQMLTHLGEAVAHGESPGGTGGVLLDLCLRCGNCEEVCQAGIPHLPLYAAMQDASDRAQPADPGRQEAIVRLIRSSPRYRHQFLQLRPAGYEQRKAAALPGTVRFLVRRAGNDAGPAATCIHCGACVAICPTEANLAYRPGADPRRIHSRHECCVGCGACVEVCPANLANGGQTLRVFEAPTADWLHSSQEMLSRLGAGDGE